MWAVCDHVWLMNKLQTLGRGKSIRGGVNERQGDIHTVLREMKGLRRLQKLIEERLVQASPERVRSNGSIGLGDP
jgi:hypothetical protein